MNESALWLPVAAAADLADAPLAVRLLERELVLWRDGAGRVAAFADRCPHRGARLSLGRVHDGLLECGYHGWRFDAQARCRVIPATPAFAPPDSHAACGHALAPGHGLLWVRLEGDAGAPPALTGLPSREVVCGPFDVHTSAPRVVENFLDTAHFGFIHERFLGDRAHTEVPEHNVTQTADGRPLVEHYRAWQPRANALAQEGAWVDYRYELLGPYSALLRKHAGGALDEAYALWVCPIEPERSRVWFTLFTGDAAVPDAALREFQATIFAQDQPLLESQHPKRLPIQPQPGGGEVHSAADRLSTAYRRHLRTAGIGFGVC